MAINPNTQYPGKVATPDADYPYGGAQNITTPGDGTGTPWEAALLNDIFGMQQGLLKSAAIVPSGTPEKVGASQYIQALVELVSGRAETYTASGTGDAIILTPKTDQEAPQSLYVGLTAKWVQITNSVLVPVTINLAGLGVQTVKQIITGANIFTGELVSGNTYVVVYDGINWILQEFNRAITSIIQDAGNYYTGNSVETALSQLRPKSGTWTPVLIGNTTAGSPTYTTQTGNYFRIGRLIYLDFIIAILAKGGMAGSIRITGLPFTGITGSDHSIAAYRGVTTGVGDADLSARMNVNVLDLRYSADAATAILSITDAMLSNSTSFSVSMCYQALTA